MVKECQDRIALRPAAGSSPLPFFPAPFSESTNLQSVRVRRLRPRARPPFPVKPSSFSILFLTFLSLPFVQITANHEAAITIPPQFVLALLYAAEEWDEPENAGPPPLHSFIFSGNKMENKQAVEIDEDDHIQSSVARKFNAVFLDAGSLVSLVLINSGRR